MPNFDDIFNNSVPGGEQYSAPPQFSKEEYAAKKKAERDTVYTLADQTAMSVAADGSKFQQYLDVQSRFGRYSANNALLILAQRPDATWIGELKYWRTQKVFIKSHERKNGFTILKQGDEYRRDDGGVGVSYNPTTVYDISQAERKILPPQISGHSERQLLSALISKAPVSITGVDELPGGLGTMTDPETGGISVRRGMEFSDTFRSLAQELSLTELTNGKDSQADPRFSAYCAAYLLCKKYGVDAQGFSFEGAPGVFDSMDAQTVKGELSQIRNAAENISGRMVRQLETQQKAAKNQDAR
jgi:hypothetical protein